MSVVGKPARAGENLSLVLGLLALLAGCVADGTDYEAFPFYAEDRAGKKGAVTRTIPPVLASVDTLPATHKEAAKGGTQSRVQVLWPIVQYRGEGQEHDLYIFGIGAAEGSFAGGFAGPAGREVIGGLGGPLLHPKFLFPNAISGGVAAFPLLGYDREHVDPARPDETKHDLGLLPLFMAGDWPEWGKWAAVAPVGGVTHGFLGKKEMDWIGFPYPLYLYVQEKDYESRHVLFPFVNWVEGPRHDGFRVLPFYAHYRKDDLLGQESYDRTWVMWPLLTWQKNSGGQGEMDEDGIFHPAATEIFFAFPFYGSVRGPDDNITSVLWPLFKYETIPSQDYWELRAPFPIFTIASGSKPERLRIDVWPLGGWRERPGYLRHFFLWPIERYEVRDDKWVEDTKFYFLPLFTYHWHLEKETNEEHTRTQVWPLFAYRRSARGDVWFHAIAPILWEDPEGFERLFYPFFRLYEYRGDALGGWSHRILLGLASVRSDPEAEGREAYSRLSLLFGMFQYRNKGGEKALSFFWLPELFTWGKP